MTDETNIISSVSHFPTQLHLKVRNILLPNETWEEIENDRIMKFSKYEQEKNRKFEQREHSGKFFVCQNLKNLLRYGIPIQLRAKYWLLVSGGQNIIDNGFSYYTDMKEKVISENFLQQSNKPFGVPIEYLENFCGFNEDIISFIQIIYYNNKNTIEFAPFIPRVCFILLTFLKDNNAAYASMQSLINNNHDGWYFETSIEDFMISSIAIQNLCHSKAPKVVQHIKSLNVDITELFLMFIFGKCYLSTPVTLTFFDSYINEGKKVFYRFFLEFLIQETKSILQSTTPDELKLCFENFNQTIGDNAHIFIEFIKKSFSLPLSRSRIIFKSDHKKSHQKNLTAASSLPEYLTASNENKSNDFTEFTVNSINLAPLFDIEMNDEYSYENDSTNESYSQNKNNESQDHQSQISSPSKGELKKIDRLKIAEIRKHSFIHAYSSLIRHMDENSILSSHSSMDPITNSTDENKENDENGNNNDPNNNNTHHHHHHHKSKRNTGHQFNNIFQKEPPKIEPEIIQNNILPTDSLLSDSEFNIIRNHMPLFCRLSNPIQAYKLSRDGASFFSFQCSVNENCPYLLIIRTKSRTVGAFLSDPPTNKSMAKHCSSSSLNDPCSSSHAYTCFSLPDYHDGYSSKLVNNVRRPGQYFGKMTTFVFSIKHFKKDSCKNEKDDSNAIDSKGNPSKVSVFPSVANCAYSRHNSNASNSSEAEEKSDRHHKKGSKKHFFSKKHKHHHNDNENSNSSTYNDSAHSNHTCSSNNFNSNSSNALSNNSDNLCSNTSNADNNNNTQFASNNNNNSKCIYESQNSADSHENNSNTINNKIDATNNNAGNNSLIANLNENSQNDKSDEYMPTLFSDSNNTNDESASSLHFIVRDKNENSNSSTLSEANDDNTKETEEYYYKRSFISVFQDSLSIGGPGPAIFIQEYLTKLYSYESKTFNSPPLTDHKNGDTINDVELYKLKKY